jgi:hypothetical protein
MATSGYLLRDVFWFVDAKWRFIVEETRTHTLHETFFCCLEPVAL